MEFIKRASDYAIRSLIYMACFSNGKVFDISSIAKKVSVPPVFLHKIFQKLCKANVLTSHKGVRGGFSLRKSSAKITVKEIIGIVQGPLLLNKCFQGDDLCARLAICSFKKRLNVLQKDFTYFFNKLTLKDLAEDEKIFVNNKGVK